MSDAVSDFIQKELRRKSLTEVRAVEAARWLDRAGLLADSRDRPGRNLRKLLREGSIAGAVQRPPGRYGSWYITKAGRSAAVAKSPRRKRSQTASSEGARTNALTENDVVAAVCRFLEGKGAQITTRASTLERGPDIVAVIGGREMTVEAKGGTSSKPGTSRYGKRFSSSQVRVHVARAFFTASAAAGDGMRLSAMAFPDTSMHRGRVEEIAHVIGKLDLGVFWVSEDGSAELDAAWDL
jgi:hypothetical protein